MTPETDGMGTPASNFTVLEQRAWSRFPGDAKPLHKPVPIRDFFDRVAWFWVTEEELFPC